MIQVPSPNCNFVKRTPQKLMARAVSGQLVTSGHVGQIWRRVRSPTIHRAKVFWKET